MGFLDKLREMIGAKDEGGLDTDPDAAKEGEHGAELHYSVLLPTGTAEDFDRVDRAIGRLLRQLANGSSTGATLSLDAVVTEPQAKAKAKRPERA